MSASAGASPDHGGPEHARRLERARQRERGLDVFVQKRQAAEALIARMKGNANEACSWLTFPWVVFKVNPFMGIA
jgi:hypothetical protein